MDDNIMMLDNSLQRRGGLYVVSRVFSSLDTVEHLALHAMLQLSSADHAVEHFKNGSFRIFLQP